MTSELKSYLIDIIDNSIVIDPDKTKESVYEQLLTSSIKIVKHSLKYNSIKCF